MGRKPCSPKRSSAASMMHLEYYICEISIQQDELSGTRFGELKELEKLYYKVAKRLRKIAQEMQEIADDEN